MTYRRVRELFYRSRLARDLYRFRKLRLLTRQLFFRLTEYPPACYVELSSLCNAACIFCPYSAIADSGKPLQRMSDDAFERALGHIEAEGIARVSFTPTTGEVLTDPRWAERMARVLRIPTVTWVNFYTNAILLDERRRTQFLALPHFEKISLSISTGGIERESYEQLFGVDRFDRVLNALHALLDALDRRGERTAVGIEVRLLKWQTDVRVKAAEAVYNPRRYVHAAVNIRRTYDPIGGVISGDVLELNEPTSRDHKPCQLMGDVRFAADGTVWLCACTVSEQPGGSTELRVGRIEDPPELLAQRRDTLMRRWREKNLIPQPCQGCSYYLEHRGWSRSQKPMFHRPSERRAGAGQMRPRSSELAKSAD